MGDIRECIGCNICAAADNTYTPIRCTQNPTMGEEWRRGWHPEHIPERGSEDQVLVVGAGPAGLECAVALGKRGYDELYGARPLARVIQEHIKKPLADEILFGKLKKGGLIRVDVDKKDPEKLVFDITPADAPAKRRGGKSASKESEPVT